ncbi:MAG: NADP(H)-dependent aldo-keto reductase [Chromatiales bacterium]
MQYSKLGNSDLDVSRLCLGTMNWGERNSQAEAHEQLDYAVAAGINLIDTAELYPVPSRAETYGRTEEYIGTWLAKRKNRSKVIIATKVAGRGDWIPWIRGGRARLNRANIEAALDASLRRLQSDYVDLYQTHWPERKSNYFGKLGYAPATEDDAVPLEDTLCVLHDLARAGKVRHVGFCNETAWGVMKSLEIARRLSLPRVVTVQNPYSLLNRTFEIGLAEVAHREQVGLMAYSPLGFGVLSGKYVNNARPEGARLTMFGQFKRYLTPEGQAATREYLELARKHGLDPAQMALAFVNTQPFVTTTLIGATRMEQLRANIASIDAELSPEALAEIEAVHTRYPNPCP